jgi:hypothetical protein
LNEWWQYLQQQLNEARETGASAKLEMLSGLLLFANGIPTEDAQYSTTNTDRNLRGNVTTIIFDLLFQEIAKITETKKGVYPPSLYASLDIYLKRLIKRTKDVLECK